MPAHREEKGGFGRFGHHPDPAIDFGVECDAIVGMYYDRIHGIAYHPSLGARLDKALDFRVGGDERCIKAKGELRGIFHEMARSARESSP